jgi:hypothetical protein
MALQVLARFESGGCSTCDQPPYDGSIVINGSVGRGGRNSPDDVKTIQRALNAVDPADGGPVLKLAVDGIVGPLTIAAIEKYQNRQLGWADGRVDTDEPTIHALNGYRGGGLAAPQRGGAKPKPVPPPKATAAENKSFIERIGALLPKARHWTEMAQIKLDLAVEFLQKGKVNPHDPFPALHDIGKPELALYDKYFHTGKLANATRIHQLQHAKRMYGDMQTVITSSLLQAPMFGWGVGYFQPDPSDGTLAANGYVAYTFFGGWHQRRKDGKPRLSGDDNYTGRKDLRQDTIFFPVGKLLTKSDNFMLVTIVHELAHFVGPGPKSSERIDEFTFDGKPNFLTVNNWTATHTAETYAYFAAESGLGKVTIPIV